MDEDELKAKRIAQYTIGQDLSELSIEEISETISALEVEIGRLQKAKTDKNDHLTAAAAFFKK